MKKPTRRAAKLRNKKYLKSLLRRFGGNKAQLREFLGGEKKRRIGLENDPIFIRETEDLQDGFEAAYLSKSKTVDAFLSRFKLPSPFHKSESQRFLERTPSKMAGLFKKYLQYTNRFNVYFVRNGGSFSWRVMPEFGWKFHVLQRDGHLEANEYVNEDEPMSDYFEDPNLRIPAPFEKLIIGEKVSKDLWGMAGTSITSFQRQFGRGKGGRPTNLKLRQQMRDALKEPGRKKEKATQLTPNVATASGQVYLSRTGKHERDRTARIAKMKKQFDSETR